MKDNEPTRQDDQSDNISSSKHAYKSCWEKLMGDDLMMKVMQNNISDTTLFQDVEDGNKNIDTGDLISNIPSNHCEAGDYVLINFDGYYISEDGNFNISYDDNDLIYSYFDNNSNVSDEKKTTNTATTTLTPFIKVRKWFLKVGSGHLLPGLEMSVRFLELNQCAIVKCHSKYAYGPYGRNGNNSKDNTSSALPPNTNVIYKVKLLNIISHDDAQIDTIDFQIKLYKEMKNIGNHYYINDWTNQDGGQGKIKALHLYNSIYKQGLDLLQCLEHGSTGRKEVHSIVVDSMNNIAATHIREKEFSKAKEAATQAIELDPYNMKALLRAGKAALMVGEYKECTAAIIAAEDIMEECDKKNIVRLKREYLKKKREHKQLEREIYSQMLSSGNKRQAGGKSKKRTTVKKVKKRKDDEQLILMEQTNHNENAGNMKPDEQSRDIHFSEQKDLRSIGIYFLVPLLAVLIWFYQKDD